jgi:hypothetical protein
MKTIEFFRGNQKTVIAAADLMSDRGSVIESLCRKFGTSRVERAREFPDLQARIEILTEDFQGAEIIETYEREPTDRASLHDLFPCPKGNDRDQWAAFLNAVARDEKWQADAEKTIAAVIEQVSE